MYGNDADIHLQVWFNTMIDAMDHSRFDEIQSKDSKEQKLPRVRAQN